MNEGLHTAILILHVLGATLIIGTAFLTLIIGLKKYSSKEILQLTELIWKIAGPLLGIQLLTGIYLARSEWDQIGKMPFFWIKMFLFFIVGGTVGFINKKHFKEMKKGKIHVSNSNWELIGFLTFLSIATLGVLIAENVH